MKELHMEKNINNLKNRIVSLIICLELIVTMMPVNVFAAGCDVLETVASNVNEVVASGDCGENGDNVKWLLDAEGVLTISGSGAMKDYTWTNFVPTTPWYEYRSSITKIVLEDGVTAIGSSAFYKLSHVTSVDISDDVLSFKAYAFASCYKVQTIELPSNLQYIANYCFENCKGLTEITIPESVAKLGDCVFTGCTSLSDVKLPSNMDTLPRGFFSECESLERITLPNSITEFVSYCFRDCSSLKEITFPTGLTRIGYRSFEGCTNLESIEIPETVTSMAAEIFYNCSRLITINIPKKIEEIPNGFCYGCTNLEQIEIPETVAGVGKNAFYNCSNLKEVFFHEGLETVGEYAFYKCNNLENIFIPKTITSFGKYSFGFYKDIYDEIAVIPNVKLYAVAESPSITYAENNEIPYSIIDMSISTDQCVYTGAEITPTINITIDEQKLVQGVDFFVEYENNINIGTATAKISFINDYENIGKIQKYYRIGNLLSDCDIAMDKEEYQYHMSVPKITIKSGDYTLLYGTDYEVYYTLEGETWKKPSSSTSRYLWDLGECVIKIVGLNQYIGEKEFIVEVKKFDLENAKLMTRWTSNGDGTSSSTSFDMQNFEYDGTEKKQSGYRICDNNDTIAGDNYEVSYRDNIDPGTATMIITGKGDYYTGTLEKKFEIYHNHSYKTVLTKATLSNNGASKQVCSTCGDVKSTKTIYMLSSVKLSTSNYTYNGKAQKPSVTVKDSKGTTLKNGTDYIVSYASGSTKIGKYKVTVTFKGNYSGSKALYFEIGPKNPSSVKTSLYGYNDVKVSWSKVSGVSGYKVYYKKSTASSWTLLKTTTSTSCKKANLSDGVKYDFKVVAYKNVSGNACENAGKTSSIYTLKKVTGVKVAKSSSKVKVSWANISGETGYQISQSTSKSKTKIVATYKTTSGKSKTIKATKGKTYYYKVRAYKIVSDKKIYGPWSSVIKYKK